MIHEIIYLILDVGLLILNILSIRNICKPGVYEQIVEESSDTLNKGLSFLKKESRNKTISFIYGFFTSLIVFIIVAMTVMIYGESQLLYKLTIFYLICCLAQVIHDIIKLPGIFNDSKKPDKLPLRMSILMGVFESLILTLNAVLVLMLILK